MIPQADLVTGHSPKASMLTFAGSKGFTPQTLAALGYHVVPGESKATRSYDRGRLIEPVKALQYIVNEYAADLGCDGGAEDSDAEFDGLSSSSESGSTSNESRRTWWRITRSS